jgi:hypothetical protein
MPFPTVLTVLTVLTVAQMGFARDALSLMMRVPARPSRPKVISIPSARRGVCTRRSRPASARGDFGHPASVRHASSLEKQAATRNRSEAFPLHIVRSDMISRMRIPTIPARDSNLKAATIPIEGGQYCPSARSWGHSAGEASRPDRLAAIFRMLSPFNVSR